MFELPKFKNRVCALTFVNEVDLPDGKKLLDCGKCRGVCYKSREAQLEHWPTHRRVCCRVEEDVRAREFLEMVTATRRGSINDVFELIRSILRDVSLMKGMTLVYSLQYLGWYLNNEVGEEIIKSDSALEEYIGRVNGYILVTALKPAVRQLGEAYLDILWAAPGFANWALSEDIILSEEMKEHQAQGALFESLYECNHRRHVSVPWTYFVRELYVATTTTTPAEDDDEEEGPMIFSKPVTTAVIKRVMRNWQSPYLRESCPWDIKGAYTRDVFLSTVLDALAFVPSPNNQHIKDATAADEVVPGLTAKDLLIILVQDDRFYHYDSVEKIGYFFQVIREECGASASETGPFSRLTYKDRIELMELFFVWLSDANVESEKKASLSWSLMTLLVSLNTSIVLETYSYIVKHKSTLRPSERVLSIYSYFRRDIIKSTLPSVRTFLECSKAKHGVILPPEDCIELIAAFACERGINPVLTYAPTDGESTQE
jgi:hypothetical protein